MIDFLPFSVHIMRIFQSRGSVISADTIKAYLRKQIHNLWGITAKENIKVRAVKRKSNTKNDNEKLNN